MAGVTCDASVGAEPGGISPGTGRAGQGLIQSGQVAMSKMSANEQFSDVSYVSRCQLMSAHVRCQQMSATSVDVSICQMMSADVSYVSRCQLMSADVSLCQMMSDDVNRCQLMSDDVRRCQLFQ